MLCARPQDGTVIVHSVRRGQFLRTLRPPGDSAVPAAISQLLVGMEGHIVVLTALEGQPSAKVAGPRHNAFILPAQLSLLLMSLNP